MINYTPQLTAKDRELVEKLERNLRRATYIGKLNDAKFIFLQLRNILQKSGHAIRLLHSKIWLAECLINSGKTEEAIAELEQIALSCISNPRLYFQSKALLAVCRIRQGEIHLAQQLSFELEDALATATSKRKLLLLSTILDRLRQENYILAMREFDEVNLSSDEVFLEAERLADLVSDNSLYEQIGKSLPPRLIEMIYFSGSMEPKLLTMNRFLYLPAPAKPETSEQRGKSVFNSVRIVLWRSLCDPESEIYKAWYTQGMSNVFTKKYYSIAVCAALADLGFGFMAVAVPITALLIKSGIEVYCHRYRPAELLVARKKES